MLSSAVAAPSTRAASATSGSAASGELTLLARGAGEGAISVHRYCNGTAPPPYERAPLSRRPLQTETVAGESMTAVGARAEVGGCSRIAVVGVHASA